MLKAGGSVWEENAWLFEPSARRAQPRCVPRRVMKGVTVGCSAARNSGR